MKSSNSRVTSDVQSYLRYKNKKVYQRKESNRKQFFFKHNNIGRITERQFYQFYLIELLFKFIDFINFHKNINEDSIFLVNF